MGQAVAPLQPLPDDRIRLEGKLERLEEAIGDLERLEGALADDWLERLPFRLDLIARVNERLGELEPLLTAVERFESTAPVAQRARALLESIGARASGRLHALGVGQQPDLMLQLKSLLQHTPLAYGWTVDRERRGLGPLFGVGLAALAAPVLSSQQWFVAAGLALGASVVSAGWAAWRHVQAPSTVWMLECDRLSFFPQDSESWHIALDAIVDVEIATNRAEIYLSRTPVGRDGRGTPVVPLQSGAVARVAGLIELYRNRAWQTGSREAEGDCSLTTAALSPGLQGWALVSAVGAAFVRDGAAEQATAALTGRQVTHVLPERQLLRELSRLPDAAIAQLAPRLEEAEGCAFLPAEGLTLRTEPRLHLANKERALTLGAGEENELRLREWFDAE